MHDELTPDHDTYPCPECGSDDVDNLGLQDDNGWIAVCLTCGYEWSSEPA